MLVKYDKDSSSMESQPIMPRTATVDFTFPLCHRQPLLSELKAENLAAIPRSSSSNLKIHESIIVEPSAYSPISSSFDSVFAHGSSAESDFTSSTEPSSPQAPSTRGEFDDVTQQDWLLRNEFLGQKRHSLSEDPKRVQLPSVHHLLPPVDYKDDDDAAQPPRSRRRLDSLRTSPELSKEYVLPIRSTMSSHEEDPITRNLNIWRKESDNQKNPLPQLQELKGASLNVQLDLGDKPTFYRETQHRPPQRYDYYYHPGHQSSSPKQMAKKGRARAKQDKDRHKCRARANDDTHCNIKYTTEETDYIRFFKVDLKHAWVPLKRSFNKRFPMASGRRRERQGIQGAWYRDNSHMPDLVNGGRTLLFNPNGHVKVISRKVRDPSVDKLYFSLIYLYPERAMNYDWVPAEARQVAADLHKERIPQRKRARLEAMERGAWVDKVEDGTCACCPKPDREKEKQKRALPKLSSGNIDFNFGKLSKL
ncbi:hypothetical protein F4779DRAFT_322745 [Xylariaceae sp. FL0662B]|nr:hypothetical protein F4779DRAFT_322745 [Xylariaceae sp. FL0662B]